MKAIVSIPMMVVSLIFQGFVISVLWGWFVVPFGITPITIPWALGLATIVGLFKYSLEDKNLNGGPLEKLLSVILINAFILLMGFIFHLFM